MIHRSEESFAGVSKELDKHEFPNNQLLTLLNKGRSSIINKDSPVGGRNGVL